MSGPTPAARVLGFGGLIPFVLAAGAAWALGPERSDAARTALLAYGATIVSFLGGIHWGFAMRRDPVDTALLAWGVLPPLLAWGALLLPRPVGLVALAVGLVACYLRDRGTFRAEGAAAWLSLRWPLTVVATLSCLAGAAAP